MKGWSGTAEAYHRSFALACAGAIGPLLDRTRGGATHLDVGCGDGRLAAAALAQGRHVSACDSDPDMCAFTRRRVPGAEVARGALPDLPYRGETFDAVTANFVLNHVASPRASPRELVRVCAPGGVVAATVWPADGAGFGGLLGPVFGHPGVVPLADQGLPQHLDFERTPSGLRGLLTAAGLADVRADEVAWHWKVSPVDLWAGIAAGIATPGMTYLAQDDTVQRTIESEFFTRATATAADGVLTFRARGVLAAGTKTI